MRIVLFPILLTRLARTATGAERSPMPKIGGMIAWVLILVPTHCVQAQSSTLRSEAARIGFFVGNAAWEARNGRPRSGLYGHAETGVQFCFHPRSCAWPCAILRRTVTTLARRTLCLTLRKSTR